MPPYQCNFIMYAATSVQDSIWLLQTFTGSKAPLVWIMSTKAAPFLMIFSTSSGMASKPSTTLGETRQSRSIYFQTTISRLVS